MSFLNHPDGPHAIESGVPPVETEVWSANCAARDCNFADDVDAAVYYLGTTPTDGRAFEYVWTCPWCGMEQADETTDADRRDL